MPAVSLDGLRFSDLAWALKLLTSTWHARPFAITTQTTVYGLLEGKGKITCQLYHCTSTLALCATDPKPVIQAASTSKL